MGDRANDPVDHFRTTRKHAGENWKNTAAMPALIAVGLGSSAVFAALFAFATAHVAAGVVAAVVAGLLMGGGFGWLGRERRRVRRIELNYLKDHPEADAQTPTR